MSNRTGGRDVSIVDPYPGDERERVCDFCNRVVVGPGGTVVEKAFLTVHGVVCEKCVGKIRSVICVYERFDNVAHTGWYNGFWWD